jgi:Glycerol uptake facilitator and related permeases (Major Intrinsic Protein Family)
MSNGDIFVGELIGTAILILFGAGVCAAVTLNKSKAQGAGWVVIAFGWVSACSPGPTPRRRCPAVRSIRP